MFKKLVFYVCNKCLEFNGQSFPLGEISRDILNFPEDKYKKYQKLTKSIPYTALSDDMIFNYVRRNRRCKNALPMLRHLLATSSFFEKELPFL